MVTNLNNPPFDPGAICVAGIVRAVKVNGDTVLADARGLYVTESVAGHPPLYDIDANTAWGIVPIRGYRPASPTPGGGMEIICHTPGTLVLGAYILGVYQFQIHERENYGPCPPTGTQPPPSPPPPPPPPGSPPPPPAPPSPPTVPPTPPTGEPPDFPDPWNPPMPGPVPVDPNWHGGTTQ